MVAKRETLSSIDARTVGALIAIFSVGMAILVFILPVGSYLATVQLMICGLGLVTGITTLAVGCFRSWRKG